MTAGLLAMALDALRTRVDAAICNDALLAGVAAFLGHGDPPAANEISGLWTYQDVALRGVSASALPSGEDTFIKGAAWLSDCQFFRADMPVGFEGDPMAILAVAIGLTRHPELDRDWMVDLARHAEGIEQDPWRRALLLGAVALLNEEVTWEGCPPEVAVALEARGAVQTSDAARDRAFRSALALRADGERAVFQLVVLEYLLGLAGNIDLHRPSIKDLCEILRRVPAALKRWPWEHKPKSKKKGVTAQKWDLQFEDHFQALLFAILRPVFVDIDDEEYVKSLGHKTPRVDFVIPSLRLAVEVKFQREATQSARAKIIEEVAADTGLYLNDGTAYDAMVAIVWDDTGSVQHHAEIEAGLRRLPGVVDAIVVSRPGSWIVDQRADDASVG